MAKQPITLLFDPIPFKGGSKVATSDALNCTDANNNHYLVLTVDIEFWQQTSFYQQHNVKCQVIRPVKWLIHRHHGVGYWLNQCYFALCILKVMLLNNVRQLIGASGPGMDMALYLVHKLVGTPVVQFVHGSVGLSRSIGYSLTLANHVFYLNTARASISQAIQCYYSSITAIDNTEPLAESYLSASHYQTFVNGIPAERWPTPSQTSMPICFWAASLLKWKGLDLLLDAEAICHHYQPLPVTVCYIRPQQTCLPMSLAPVERSNIQWWEDPDNLDQLRSEASIFVSTSQSEPFGLSILEALAAGMCVVLPQDGAYWDQHLTHTQNCIKYQPNDAESLAHALLLATNDSSVMQRCQRNAAQIASQYRAEVCYASIASTVGATPTLVTQRVHE
ncbi:glycosyltransferase family 4 protein [Vibrio sp. JPW-9-11-11]|uniref:glycosyltransferase family 4 protein n=1 Tax=Vibrio sp. JPW-9-11-11 TaxID=1416532 RepID=UPI0015939E5A|nr:glycosyltransferase family 4 protein [Vibrio sp. JPW-9-11-11]NVD06715.1 glycosyltransferase family 4 protein [Vibrio sp. JPW-9-11-11]